jgi:hypothetical protein
LQEIEVRTGIDFLPDDDGDETLENSVPTLWQ